MTDYNFQVNKISHIQEIQSQGHVTTTNSNDQQSIMPRDPNIVKRPTTAGVNRQIMSKELSKERLASNFVLNENSKAKQQIRKGMFLRGFSGNSN
jgi:hypothetical protein